jgi:hypothetical protein
LQQHKTDYFKLLEAFTLDLHVYVTFSPLLGKSRIFCRKLFQCHVTLCVFGYKSIFYLSSEMSVTVTDRIVMPEVFRGTVG